MDKGNGGERLNVGGEGSRAGESNEGENGDSCN